jgi:hypothetical protein
MEENFLENLAYGWYEEIEPLEPEEQYEIAIENAASTILLMTKTHYSPETLARAKKVAFAFFSSQYGEHSAFATDDLDVQNAFVVLMNKALDHEKNKSKE